MFICHVGHSLPNAPDDFGWKALRVIGTHRFRQADPLVWTMGIAILEQDLTSHELGQREETMRAVTECVAAAMQTALKHRVVRASLFTLAERVQRSPYLSSEQRAVVEEARGAAQTKSASGIRGRAVGHGGGSQNRPGGSTTIASTVSSFDRHRTHWARQDISIRK